MAPVQKISSYSVAASSSLDLTSKVELNSDYRTESSEHWHAPLFIAPSGTAFSDDFFENARARFHHELTNFLAEWDDAEEDMDDNWFGKETLLSRRLSPQTQLSSHSKIRDNKFAACVNENGDYEVMMNICQLKLKDIKVRVTGERDVVVEGHKEEGSRLRDCHKSPRRFLYQFSLPDKATSDAISAVLSRDGILIITIPSKAQNARNTKISLMGNDIVNRANIIGESTEQCGRKSKVTEIQKRQSAAETSGSNMTESSHQGSLEAVPGPVPVVRYEKEKFQTLEKAEDGLLLGRKNDLCIESSMASLKISSSSTSSFFESKDSSSKISLANEKRVRETIIPIRMEESVDKCGTTIFHHSSLNKKESCQDNDSLHHHESSNGNVALSQSEVSVTNSTELQDEVLRCTNDNEESFAQLKHSTFAQRSEGLQLPSEGNIMSRDTESNEMVTANKCMARATRSRNTKFSEQEILSEAKNSEIIARDCGISEGTTDEKKEVANFHSDEKTQAANFHSDKKTQVANFHSDEKTQVGNFHPDEKTQVANFHSDEKAQVANFHSDEKTQVANFHTDEKTQVANFHSDEKMQVANFHSDEKMQVANFHSVDLVQNTSRDSEEETRSFLFERKRGKPMTSGISQELQIMNKGRFLEDSHFVSVKGLVISALTEILSRNGSVPENGDLVGFYRKCQEENFMECDALSFSQEEDSSCKFVVDVYNFMRQSLTVCVKNGKEICIEGRHQPKRGTLQHSEDFTKSLVLPWDAVTDSASASVSSDGFLLVSVDKEGYFARKSKGAHDGGMGETTVTKDSNDEEEANVFKEVNKLSQEHQGQQVLTIIESDREFASDSSAASLVSSASVATSRGIAEERIGNVKTEAEQQQVLSISETITPRAEEDAKFFDFKDRKYFITQEQGMSRLPSERADSDEFQDSNSLLKREQQQQSLLEIQTLETSINGLTEEVIQEQQGYLVTSPSSTPFEETGKLQELEASVTAIEELQGISSTDTCSPLLVQQKGLFDEDDFYESVRHYFKVQKMETSYEHADSSFVSDDGDDKRIIPLLDDQDEYEKTNCFDNENEYTIILNVGDLQKETEMEVKVVSGNKVLIRCSSSLNEGELDHLRVFSKTFHLPHEIDVTSGLCGISLDGILAITFTKKVPLDVVQATSLDGACSDGSSQKDWESFILGGNSVLTLEESSNSEDFTGQELTLSLSQEQFGDINSSYSEEAITEKTTATGNELCEESESFSRDTNDFWQATCSTTHDASHSRKMTHESESVQFQDPLQVMNAGESKSGEKTLLTRVTTANDAMEGMLAGMRIEEASAEEVGIKVTSLDGHNQKDNVPSCYEGCNVNSDETEMMRHKRNTNASLEMFSSPSLFEHQELKSCERFSCARNGIILNVEEKGRFDEDAFFERARSLFVNRTDRLSSVGDEQTKFKTIPVTTHGEENKAATFSDDGQHYMAILDVSRCTNKTQLYIQVIEGKKLLIEYPEFNEGESENVEYFSMTFDLPCGIDVESGVCGISSDGILFIVFSKMNLESNEAMSWNQSGAKTLGWYSLNGISPSKGNFFQNEGFVSGAEKCEASAQECFVSSTTYSGVCNLKEQSNSSIKLLPITRKGNFFQDSFFQEVQHLFQRAIKKVLRNSTDQETCRHASDIKTYKCFCKQNPAWQNRAFHVEDDHISCQILLDVQNVTEESTTVYVTEEKDLVIEGQLKKEEESSSQLRTCRRCFSLPSNVDFSEGAAALSSDGILYVAFQKTKL